MKKKDSSTGNNNTYAKEQVRHLKRIRRFIKDAEKRGYRFYDRKIPKSLNLKVGTEEYTVPRTVKNPTAVTVKRLEKITKEYLYDRAIWVDPESHEVFTAEEGRRIERSRAAKKGAETRKRNQQKNRPPDRPQPPPDKQPYWNELARVRQYLVQVQNATSGWPKMDDIKQERGRYLVGFFDDCVSAAQMDNRLYEYSEHLKNKADVISNLVDAILPDSRQETVEANVGAILSILNEGPLSASQSADYQNAMDYGTGVEGVE